MSEVNWPEIFKGTNFGRQDYANIVIEGLNSVALGYHNGHTLNQILHENGWTEIRERNHYVLTEKGLDLLKKLSFHGAKV